MQKNVPLNSLQRLKHYADRLQGWLTKGQFAQFSARRRRRLVRQLQRLHTSLTAQPASSAVRKVLAHAALVAGLATPAAGQQIVSFGTLQNSPFSLTTTTQLAFVSAGDLDNDGDQDLLVGEAYGGLKYFKNVGTPTAASFATGTSNPFGLVPTAQFAIPTLTDIDSDGDLDLFVSEYYGAVKFFKNNGTPALPAFAAPVTNPFGITAGTYFAAMTFADIDNDGDKDLFYGEYGGNIQYFPNTGTPTAPAFGTKQTNPFGLAVVSYQVFPTLVDLDVDGDLDMVEVDSYNNVYYFQNNGTNVLPAFGMPQINPFGIAANSTGSYLTHLAFADMDNDGDKDLWIGASDYYAGGVMWYQPNNSGPNSLPASADTSVAMNQGATMYFMPDWFAFNDADTMQTLDKIKITALPTGGALQLQNTAVAVGQEIVAFDILQLSYTPNAAQYGMPYDSLQFQVHDGLAYSTDYTLTFNVNGLPTAADKTINTPRNQPYAFSTADFGYADPEGQPLASVKIATIPSKGILALNGTPVAGGQVVAVTDLPTLSFTPVMNEIGSPYVSFAFQVNDGTAFSTTLNNLTINVLPPVATHEAPFDAATVSLSPNPATDVVRIVTQTPTVALTAFNSVGQVVHEVAPNATTYRLDVSTWQRGVYHLRIQTERGIVTKTILLR